MGLYRVARDCGLWWTLLKRTTVVPLEMRALCWMLKGRLHVHRAARGTQPVCIEWQGGLRLARQSSGVERSLLRTFLTEPTLLGSERSRAVTLMSGSMLDVVLLCCHLLRLTKKMLNKELAALVCYLKGIDLRACSKTAGPVFQAMSRPELLQVLAAETSQRDGDTDDITANFVAQAQALHNNAAGNDRDSDESVCKADKDDLEFDAMVLEDMDPEDRREFDQVQKTIEKHQARVKQKECAVVRKAMTLKAKAKAKAKAKTKAKSKAKTKAKAKAKASNKANIIKGQKLKTAESSSSKVASKASRKIWHGALKKKRQDCPALALREGDTHEKGNVLGEVPAEVEAVTPNPWQRRVVRRTHSVSSCPESARPAAQAEAAPEERPASVAEDNSTAPPEDTPASVADDGNRLRAQADLPPASHTQSPSKPTSNGHSDEPLTSQPGS